MSEIVRPYFMENEEWYRFNAESFTYELTDKAPPKAVKSFNEFYELLEELEEPEMIEEL